MEPRPIRFLRNLGRSREIVTVLLNYGFGDIVDRLGLGRYLRWGKRILFRQREEVEQRLTTAQRVRMALESLGPTFIKFGQVISTRPDLVPPEIIQELSQLQENVPPFPTKKALQMLETELGAPVRDNFSEFEMRPLAAGSLAQVHRAVHRDGTPVAIKIRRPNVVREVERDLSLMNELALLVERHIPEAEIFDPSGLVNYFARTIRRELNFLREGRTIDKFARLFRDDATLFVPRVFSNLTTEAVLTMEFVDGCRISDKESLERLGVTPRELACNGARIFMKMAFELGVFHGDPHPGNIRVMPDGSFALLDYGMIGVLEDNKRDQVVDLFQAVVRQDLDTATDLVMQLGRPFRPVDVPLLRADLRDFIENYYGMPLEKLNVGNMLSDFVTVLSQHGIRCPADLMLLIRIFITLEGTGRELDPDFNLAEELAPFVERVVRDRYNPRRVASRMIAETRALLSLAHDVPRHVGRTLEKLSRDDLKMQLEHRGLEHLITELDRSSNRLAIGMVISALVVATALIIRTGTDMLWFSAPAFVLSFLLGMWLIYGVFRSGRL